MSCINKVVSPLWKDILKVSGKSILNWFESYFEDRKNIVSIGNYTSELANMTCGAPQGPIPGLFSNI